MPKPITKKDSSRIQSSQAKAGHDVGEGTFGSRAQSAADKHQNQQGQQSQKANKAKQVKRASKAKPPKAPNRVHPLNFFHSIRIVFSCGKTSMSSSCCFSKTILFSNK